MSESESEKWDRLARERVFASAKMRTYRDVILGDWSVGHSHQEWVATAPENEILEWAAKVADTSHYY